VILVEYLRYGYGQHVIMGHGNGITSLYGHMSEIYVKVGDNLKRGQILGRMGSTGRSTGTHLHFEIRKNGITQNPLSFLK
jgi:murein DD-endopeptidase MepM/ murein hydrolase activator NlpD